MPPEIRVGSISANRRVIIEFTNAMEFPDTAKFIEENKKSGNKLLDLMMLSGDNEAIDPNLLSWVIVSVTSTTITVDLEFLTPLTVSQGDVPDKLIVQAGLQKYPDHNKIRLPPSVVRTKGIPP